jgi:hypothetical protein
MDPGTLGNIGQIIGGLSPLLSTGAQMYGQQNAGQAIEQANNAGIATQQGSLANINSIYGQQATLGNNAFNALGSTLGINGQPANYSNFMNMPGYQFAVNQGTQAIQRQAAAMGNAYTPNTAAAVGQYVTGTAMQDYNNYVNQLVQAGGFGASANQNLGNATLGVNNNISQLQANTGMGQAGMYTGMGQTAAGATGGVNGSGVSGLGGVVNGIGNIVGGISGLLGGGANNSTNSAINQSSGLNYLYGGNAPNSYGMTTPDLGMSTDPYTSGLDTSGDIYGDMVGTSGF